MKAASVTVIGILLFATAPASPAPAETRQLTWNAVTTYTDGTPIGADKTVRYTVCWSNDPWLAGETLRTVVSEYAGTSVTFDPAAEGMSDYQTVYFSVKTVLSSGEQSELSDTLPWTPPPSTVAVVLPMAPDSLGITNIATSSSAGTWELFWDPVTKDTSGATIDGSTVRYTLYWTTDGGLSPESLTPLASSIMETSFVFDPSAFGMQGNKRVYFAARTVLTTGAESSLSASLSWRASNNGPGSPKNGRMVRRNKK